MATWKKISLALLLVLAAVAGGFLWKSRMAAPAPVAMPAAPPAAPHATIVQGRAYCSVSTQVTTPAGGEVQEVPVQIGQAVKKDQVLLVLKIAPNERAVLSGKINTYNSQSGIEMNAQQLETKHGLLLRQISEAEQLMKLNLISRNALMDLQEQLALVEKQLASIRAALAEMRQNRSNELDGISRLYGQPVHPGRVPYTVLLRAPMDGHVIWLAPAARPGAVVVMNQPLVTVGIMDPMTIRGQIHESEVALLAPGDRAEVTLDAGKGETVNATLTTVSWAPQDNAVSAASYYLFELTVVNPDLKIKDGNKVQVSFPAQDNASASSAPPAPAPPSPAPASRPAQ